MHKNWFGGVVKQHLPPVRLHMELPHCTEPGIDGNPPGGMSFPVPMQFVAPPFMAAQVSNAWTIPSPREGMTQRQSIEAGDPGPFEVDRLWPFCIAHAFFAQVPQVSWLGPPLPLQPADDATVADWITPNSAR